MPRACPCGSGAEFATCCGPLHRGRGSGRVTAATAEQLMRSRYSAFVVRDVGYLLATWHPDTCPATLELDPDVEWRGLTVLATRDGGPEDDTGTVEFVARHWHAGLRVRGEQHEDSAFVRVRGQWVYTGPVG